MCIKTKKYPNGETKIYLGNGTKGSIAAIRYYYRQGRFLQCWYELANQFCQEIAREYELSLEIVAAVVAVLSHPCVGT